MNKARIFTISLQGIEAASEVVEALERRGYLEADEGQDLSLGTFESWANADGEDGKEWSGVRVGVKPEDLAFAESLGLKEDGL